jgi:hypothetical protein
MAMVKVVVAIMVALREATITVAVVMAAFPIKGLGVYVTDLAAVAGESASTARAAAQVRTTADFGEGACASADTATAAA